LLLAISYGKIHSTFSQKNNQKEELIILKETGERSVDNTVEIQFTADLF